MKGQRNGNIISKCTQNGRDIGYHTTEIYFCKTLIIQQVLCGAAIWYQKNSNPLKCFQNDVTKAMFKRDPSPSIEACGAITGLGRLNICCESIAIKFAIQIILYWTSVLYGICRPANQSIDLGSRATCWEASLKSEPSCTLECLVFQLVSS